VFNAESMSDWDFKGHDVNEFTHGIHLYPAKLNPRVARKLIKQYGKKASNIWDPFCGSGTTLVEGRLYGLNVYGNDINPTAIEISLAKSQNYDIKDVRKLVSSIDSRLDSMISLPLKKAIRLSGFKKERIMDWFTSMNVIEISSCFQLIESLAARNDSNEETLRFARMCLSDCIRKVSFQRSNEWKLYRVKDWRIGKQDKSLYKPLIPLFRSSLITNLKAIERYVETLESRGFESKTTTQVVKNDCAKSVDKLRRGLHFGFDLVVTSPPYGDSPTTMAYEQFSWLPNVWLGLDSRPPGKLAKEMLGGLVAKEINLIGYKPIDQAIANMNARVKEGRSEKDHNKLTKEIKLKNYSFYRDYLESIKNIASMVNEGGYVCFVLGNRISGGQEMRLDLFTDWAFKQNGFKKVGKTKKRNIPSTRMPKANPSGSTMNHEYIVVLRKE
jgi:site-specific DNA-methyltransferase (cytosine-N4-specific)